MPGRRRKRLTKMNLGVLFSGGKDSTYSLYLAKEEGHKISCLISLFSENKESYMFHTPSIEKTAILSKKLRVPAVLRKTCGEKEKELEDLRQALREAKKKYKIEGVVSGAVASVYQASRIQKVCFEESLWCFNPLWLMNQGELLESFLSLGFRAIVVGVFAYPLDRSYLGKEIDRDFLREMKRLNRAYGINIAGEGGEYESLVLDGPVFFEPARVEDFKDFGEGNSWRREVEIR